MTMPILPKSLRMYRERKGPKGWTQKQLHEATTGKDKVSEATIKRIEGHKQGAYAANERVAQALAKALGVTIAQLASAPTGEIDHEDELKKYGYRPLRTMIDAETALAFNMVQHIYGIPIRSQIEMAPLFMTLLAEGSLEWRRIRVAEIEEATTHLGSLGGGHLSFANATYRAEEGAAAERQSIERGDLFGKYVGDDTFSLGFDPSQNNPFADYLEDFASKVAAKVVTFPKTFRWKTSEGLPHYRVGGEIIEQITDGDPDAEFALLRNYVRLKDIPADLFGNDKSSDRVAWIVAHIPAVELAARKAERKQMDELLELDLTHSSSDTLKGGKNV